MQLTLEELLKYAGEEQARWEAWFASHGDEPLAIPTGGDRPATVGQVIQHAFGAELWFAEHLREVPVTEWWTQPAEASSGLFALGRAAKRALGAFIRTAGPEDWSRVLEFSAPGRTLRASARKAVANALVHEIRHWAQIATLVRQRGMAPPGEHDLIVSRALE